MIEADRADYSRAKLDHVLIVSITKLGSRVGTGGMTLQQECREETCTVCVGTRINI